MPTIKKAVALYNGVLQEIPNTDKIFGYENVDNTSDVNKPISNPTQAALDAKAALKGTDTVYGGAKFSLNGTILTITTQ